jgi:phosphinothricin acetyltransferase
LGEQVEVRGARPGDAEAVLEIYRPVVLETSISFEEDPPDIEEMRRRFTARPRLPWLVAESEGQVVGYAYASRHRDRASYRWSADCSVYLAPSQRGRGIGRLLYQRLVPELRELGYVSLFAGIALPNPASVGLHQAIGFRLLGVYPNVGFKLGRWHEVAWWFLPLTTPPPTNPPTPREWYPPDECGTHGSAAGENEP